MAFLLLILILGGFFRFYHLDRWSLWTDELYTWRIVPELSILTEGVPDDQHPPLYHILVHYLIRINDSEIWLRFPSALAGFLAIPLMRRIALNKREWGLLAALLLAISPLHIWYSREARMYGLASLFWIASIFFYICLIHRDKWGDVLGLAVATLAGILTAYPTLGLWGIEISCFWVLWHLSGQKRNRLLRWLMAQLLIGAGFYWWWPYFQQQLARSRMFDWPVLLGFDLSGTLADTIQLAFLGGLFILLGGIVVWLLIWWQPQLLIWVQKWRKPMAFVVVLAFIAATIVGAIPRGLSIRRQLLVFWPLGILVAAWALLYLQQRWLLWVTVGLSFALAFLPVFGSPLEDWRGTAVYIAEAEEGDDYIVLAPHWMSFAFDYYYQGDATYEGMSGTQFENSQAAPFVSGERVWLVIVRHPISRAVTAPVDAWFEANADPLSTQSFPRDIMVIEYQIR